jgi:hypothetical protein
MRKLINKQVFAKTLKEDQRRTLRVLFRLDFAFIDMGVTFLAQATIMK